MREQCKDDDGDGCDDDWGDNDDDDGDGGEVM